MGLGRVVTVYSSSPPQPPQLPGPQFPGPPPPRRRSQAPIVAVAVAFAVVLVLVSGAVAGAATGLLPVSFGPFGKPDPTETQTPQTTQTSPVTGKASPRPSQPPLPPVADPKLPDPLSYQFLTAPQRYEIDYLNGTIDLERKKRHFMLGFRVEEKHRNRSELLKINEQEARTNGRPVTPITVNGASGFMTEYDYEQQPGDPPGSAGRYLMYVVAKGAVTVTLTVFSPDGVISPERKVAAKHVIHSLTFDESKLKGTFTGNPPKPVFPFSYDVPDGLRGYEHQTGFGNAFVVRLRYLEPKPQVISLVLHFHPDVASASKRLREEKRKLAATSPVVSGKLKIRDAKATNDPRLGALSKQVDEGYGVIAADNTGDELVFFLLRKGDRLLYVNADVRQGTLELLSSLRFNE